VSDAVTAIAEAVADGRTPDWRSVEGSSCDPTERAVIDKLRAVQSIAGFYSSLAPHGGESPSAVLAPGSRWGALVIRAHLGRGRFGDVYRAWDPALDRDVALKLLRQRPGEEGAATQVVDEGRLMARVRQPNVITIFGAQRIDGVPGLWMELVDGRTLAAELADRGPLPASDLIAIGTELSDALRAVHDAGLVHRDVKAQNVMRDRTGRVLLGDFGTGRELVDTPAAAEGLAGTPAYLAPELFAQQPASAQSDLYSLAALLFHLATGTYPVEARSIRELCDAHRDGRRIRLGSLRPDLPRDLVGVVDRALDPDPRRRFPDAVAMRRALQQCRPGEVFAVRRVAVPLLLMLTIAVAGLGMWRRSVGPVAPFAARDFVLVTAFDNQTGDAQLDGVFELALARELSDSAFVNVVSQARIDDALRLMRQPEGTRVTAAIGREVALRDGGVRVVLAGRVRTIGHAYSLAVDIVVPQTGDAIASVQESNVAAEDLVTVVTDMARQVRRQLGESLPVIATGASRLQKVSTSSLRALQFYSRARALSNEEGGIGFPNARATEELLREALRDDPEFVMAHVLLAHAIPPSKERIPEILKLADLAVAAAERGSAIDRYLARAEWHVMQTRTVAFRGERWLHHRRESAALFEALLELQPDNEWALACLSNIYPDLGRPADAVRVTKRIVAIRPNSLTALWRATRALAANKQRDEAVRFAARANAIDVVLDERNAGVAAWTRGFTAFAAWLDGKPRDADVMLQRMASEIERLPAQGQSEYALPLIQRYLMLGQLDNAEWAVAFLTPELRPFWATRVARERGDPTRLRSVLQRLYPTPDSAKNVLVSFVDSGQIDWVREGLRRLDAERVAPAEYLALLRAKLAVVERRFERAARHLEPYLLRPGPWRGSSQWVAAVLTMVEAQVGLGRTPSAIELLEEASRDRAEFPPDWAFTWLGLRARLAELYHAAGRSGDAVAVASELRALLILADDDHPIKRRLSNVPAGEAGQ
jgi:tetratricopeptide (TPR) repeat protein